MIKILFYLHLGFGLLAALILTSTVEAKLSGNYENKTEYIGYYFTPSPDNLESMSRWPLDYVKWVRSGNRIKASYYLPAPLVGGKSQKIVMKGVISPSKPFFELRGKRGVASCRMSAEEGFVCITKFKGLRIKPKAVESLIEGLKISEAKKSSRMLVAKLFQADPIGVIIIKKR